VVVKNCKKLINRLFSSHSTIALLWNWL